MMRMRGQRSEQSSRLSFLFRTGCDHVNQRVTAPFLYLVEMFLYKLQYSRYLHVTACQGCCNLPLELRPSSLFSLSFSPAYFNTIPHG